MTAAAASIATGIVFGTLDTAVTINDYQLAALIAEGVGAGQLNYALCSVAVASVSSPTCGFVVSRSAVNNNAADIIVKESGIYMTGGAFNFLAVRDVFAVPLTIPNGGAITTNYTLRISV
jgi:hypothetical protein